MVIFKNFIYLLMISLILNASQINAEKKPEKGENEGYLAFAEQMPAPSGGIQEIYKKIVYPKLAKDAGIEGKVYVLAFINETGRSGRC